MQQPLYQRICAACDGLVCLQRPPPLKRNFWNHYRKLDALLTENHTAALHLLEERAEEPDVTYETPVPQTLLNELFSQGASSMMSLDRDLKGLIETANNYPEVEGYLTALTQLRENVGLTLKHYYRLKGSGA